MTVFNRCLAIILFLVLFAVLGDQIAAAKIHRPVVTKTTINAKPEVIFEAIREYRDSAKHRRKLVSCNGKFAKIKESMINIPVYGRVECLWQEEEFPYERIEYTLLESNKFKSGYGTWLLIPSEDGKSTKLELKSFLDTGITLPFADQFTKSNIAKENILRLGYIKSTAEAIARRKEGTPAKK